MTICLKYHDTGATVERGDEILHVYGWPKNGGHVWETVFDRGGPANRGVCYRGSRNTILTEATPRETAKNLADLHGIADSAIFDKWSSE